MAFKLLELQKVLWLFLALGDPQRGTPHQSCPAHLLHDLFLILFIEVIFALFCSFYFFPYVKGVCVLPLWESFLIVFYFLLTCMICSFEEDSSLVTQQLLSWRKSIFLCHHPSRSHGEVCIRKACSCVQGTHCSLGNPDCPSFHHQDLGEPCLFPGRFLGCFTEILWRQGINKSK